MKEISKKSATKIYNPNLGFIGNVEVQVANYLFSAKKTRKAYLHAEPVAKRILKKAVAQHFQESQKLTQFIKTRDLTFSKKMKSGYKTFTVPCTTTVVPIQKSLFNEVEQASQRLIISLRKVLQDIYGAKTIEESEFVKSLPEKVRTVFLKAIKTSAAYYPQLHHPNMKKYPFFDNVGLDLVLVEDYLQKTDKFPKLIARNESEQLPGLPFRILELNAGSPSGASNNMNMLEGIYEQNPEILDSLGKVMPNDHFEVLGRTYKSLGENWTDIKTGVQVILPPGGENGASPEIHQLAAYSGLIYADADQLYQDDDGYIRLRTVNKENPIVTAIYSRVNSDSALFDPDKGLIMRDPDSGEGIYLRDELKKEIGAEEGEGELILDSNGNPLPLQSSYAIPGAIDAIVNRKLYMGGLNRILDNKIILATLTHYAPKYFAGAIKQRGLDPEGTKILPPQTLPPTAKSVEIIKSNPDDWVVKSPNLAGGQGVFILKTLGQKQKREVIKMIEKRPEEFAYQQLVKIGRIPVAVKRKTDGHRFANLAADIRLWVFFGGAEDDLPQLTHNALVRYAPQERGKMSSIVNTSAGGGYAPFVIIDDVNDKNSVNAKELTKSKVPMPLACDLPVFVGAQIVQIARMLKQIKMTIDEQDTTAQEIHALFDEMKKQLKEVLSFLHPRSIESVYKALDIVSAKIPKKASQQYSQMIFDAKVEIIRLLNSLQSDQLAHKLKTSLDDLYFMRVQNLELSYRDEEKVFDLALLKETARELKNYDYQSASDKKCVRQVLALLKGCISSETPHYTLNQRTRNKLISLLEEFCESAKSRLNNSNRSVEFTQLFSLENRMPMLKFETLYLGEKDQDLEIQVATQFEMRSGKRLVETDYVDERLKKARQEWLKIVKKASRLEENKRDEFLSFARRKHLARFSFLRRYQQIINSQNVSKEELIELLPVLPYAKFNIEQFAKEKGLSIAEVFTSKFRPGRISILSTEKLKQLKLCNREFAGECFAKKRKSHGLFSKSDIFIWLRRELDPFTLIYTAGHELIHYRQILSSMNAEKRAIKDGGLSFAKCLNYYGNFLGSNNRTLEALQMDIKSSRKPFHGFSELLKEQAHSPFVREIHSSLLMGDVEWDKKMNEYGSLLGSITSIPASMQVKALQEVLPALENAKNILFAKELGLEIKHDPTMSAMPSANAAQIKMYSKTVKTACESAAPNWEALRIIAGHQYHGVTFSRADKEEHNLTLVPRTESVTMGASYNQTQQ